MLQTLLGINNQGLLFLELLSQLKLVCSLHKQHLDFIRQLNGHLGDLHLTHYYQVIKNIYHKIDDIVKILSYYMILHLFLQLQTSNMTANGQTVSNFMAKQELINVCGEPNTSPGCDGWDK